MELEIGFEWDGSTRPWVLGLFLFKVGPDFEASAFHDKWCEMANDGRMTAKDANDMYNDLMRESVSTIGRLVRYYGVVIWWKIKCLFRRDISYAD
jgi:hypothetical protein